MSTSAVSGNGNDAFSDSDTEESEEEAEERRQVGEGEQGSVGIESDERGGGEMRLR